MRLIEIIFNHSRGHVPRIASPPVKDRSGNTCQDVEFNSLENKNEAASLSLSSCAVLRLTVTSRAICSDPLVVVSVTTSFPVLVSGSA